MVQVKLGQLVNMLRVFMALAYLLNYNFKSNVCISASFYVYIFVPHIVSVCLCLCVCMCGMHMRLNRAAVKAVLVLLPILGLTWLCGVLVPFSIVMAYIFILLNSLQVRRSRLEL